MHRTLHGSIFHNEVKWNKDKCPTLVEQLKNLYIHVAEYNAAVIKEVGLRGDHFISPPLDLSAQTSVSLLLLVPSTLTIMEPTTGPLITHHRAVLSFISQQLWDRQKEERWCLGAGSPARQRGGTSPPVALKGGWLKGALRDCTPKPNPAPSALVLSSAPLSRLWLEPRSQGTDGLLGKDHIPPWDLRFLGMLSQPQCSSPPP